MKMIQNDSRHKWLDKAQCVGAPIEIFFPTSMANDRWEAGKAVCATCEVKKQCLELVLRLEHLEDRWGIFGGLTPAERSNIRFARQKYI
jgi:WhiB family redox-sensing transcriptional regulator